LFVGLSLSCRFLLAALTHVAGLSPLLLLLLRIRFFVASPFSLILSKMYSISKFKQLLRATFSGLCSIFISREEMAQKSPRNFLIVLQSCLP
jgi:hypothetical protein